jgi:two-component system, sensor histidine kinase and response regulator
MKRHTDVSRPVLRAGMRSRFAASNWGPFLLAVAASTAVLTVYSVAILLQLAGTTRTPALETLGLAIAQFIAAGSCFGSAGRASQLRLSWLLLGAATTCGGLGRLIGLINGATQEASSWFMAAANLSTLLGVALGLGAVLALPSGGSRVSARAHATVNAAIIAISFFFVAWMVALSEVYRVSRTSPLDLWLAVGYVTADVMLIAILWQATHRARGPLRSVVVLMGAAFLVIAITTLAVSYLTAVGRLEPQDRILDSGFVAAFLMVALAPLWPGVKTPLVLEEGPVKTSAVAIPPGAIAAVVLSILGLKLLGRPVDSSQVPIVLGVVLMLLLTIGEVLAHRDSLNLLAASRRAEAQLWDRTQLLDEVISHTPSGLTRVGPGLRIIDANPRACSLLGAGPQALIGAPLADYLPQPDVHEAVARLRRFDAPRNETVQSDSCMVRVDGTQIWVRWSMTAVRNVQNEVDYFILMLEDVDAKHSAERAAIANLAGLERLNRLKSEFVSMISHEFRTALTGIQGFSELMRDSQLDEADVHHFATDIFSEAERLTRLITDMLDLDRIEAGRLTFRFGQVDLNGVVADAVERVGVASTKHVIRCRFDPTLPLISADHDRLLQVLTNLLSNAIKYSPDGGDVLVSTRAGPAVVVVSVRDAGCGIPAEFMDRLFERYERYETIITRTVVGTGLGLAIARRIVEGHGGRIWAESKVGEGSEFFVSFPRP